MPRVADAAVRDRLVTVAADLLATGEDVSLRRVATAAGTSTMAVYTHFDGMPGLWLAVREQAFASLAVRLGALEATADPVADLVASGCAYVATAMTDRNLYLAMFDIHRSAPQPRAAAMTFAVLVAGVERAVAEGRLRRRADVVAAATQLWAMTHGVVMLVLSEALPPTALDEHLPPMYAAHLVGLGAGPRRATVSTRRGWTSPLP